MFWINLERNSEIPITVQIFQQIRGKIFLGELSGGTKLPSTREMSDSLNVSRNVMVNAYEQLTAEGYIYTVSGSGTFVTKDLRFSEFQTSPELYFEKKNEAYSNETDLNGGIPDLKNFPVRKWKECYTNVLNSADSSVFNYPSAGGENSLKYEISKYLLRSRGITANPENIFITSGSTDNFRIISRLFNSHSKIAVENPVFKPIQKIFISCGKTLIPVETGLMGMNPDLITDDKLDFIFTTPSHQYPLAVTLSAENRIKLIRKASEIDTYIFEDDYDTEFRYTGNSISSLYSLSPERVIYSGTFSKTLSPALRIAFMVIPDAITEKVSAYFSESCLAVSKLNQLTLAEFIHSGFFEKHIKKMRKIYGLRYNFLKERINDLFKTDVVLHTNGSGLHLVAEFKNSFFNENVLEDLKRSNIVTETVNMHLVDNIIPDNRIIVSFSNNDEKKLNDALLKIKKVISSAK